MTDALRKRLLPITLTLLALSASSRGQVPAAAQATGLIIGQVVDADGGRPVPESVVTLTPESPGGAPVSPAVRDAASRKIITDSSGRFVYRDLAKGRYSITAMRPGYVAGAYGKVVPRGQSSPIDLGDGERMVDVRVLMWKHAVIAGRVLDEAGEPVVGAQVKALRRSIAGGRVGVYDAAKATTDDRGMFRFGALTPDSYIVGVPSASTSIPSLLIDEYFRATGDARVRMQQALFAAAPTMTSAGGAGNRQIGDYTFQVDGRMPLPPTLGDNAALAVYPSTFYSDVARAIDATVITLKSGEFRAAVDLHLRPVPAVRVSGVLAGPDGPVGIAAVQLFPSGENVMTNVADAAVATTVATAAGAFTFYGVPAGSYELRVLILPPSGGQSAQLTTVQVQGTTTTRGVVTGDAPVPTQPTLWASQPITVGDRDLSDLRVTLRSGFRVSGRVVFEGGAQGTPLQRIMPIFEAADRFVSASLPEIAVAADGTFTSIEVPPGKYRFTVPVPSGWLVKSAISGGRDLVELPFELDDNIADVVVTLTNRGARVAGIVRNASSVPDANASLILFPVDPRQWVDISAYARGIREARTGRDGTYAVGDLLAGDYFIVALPPGGIDWSRPNLLDALSRVATRITLADGEQRSLDLRLGQVK